MSKSTSKVTSQALSSGQWTKRFWLALGTVLLLAACLLLVSNWQSDEKSESFFNLSVRTQSYDGRNILCELKLLIHPDQEQDLEKRKVRLDSVVSETLASNIDPFSQRPNIQALPEDLQQALNRKLPKHLQVKGVYIQNLVYGLS